MANIKKTNKSEKIAGTRQDDVINAMGGDDTIWGWQGDDKIICGTGDDLVVVYSGKDDVVGGAGFDMLDFYYAKDGIVFDLATGAVNFVIGNSQARTTFSGMEGAWGSKFGDTMFGNGADNDIFSMQGNDTIDGRGGDDVINAYTGNDVISGGNGDDTLVMAPGTDTFDGGDGQDALDFYFSKVGITVSLSDASAAFKSKDGTGTTTFSNVEVLFGSLHDDELTGTTGNDRLGANNGDDTLIGLAGDDILGGGAGSDSLTGDDGLDFFVFSFPVKNSEIDTVTDFVVADDSLIFSANYFKVTATGPQLERDGYEYKAMAAAQFEINDDGVAHSKAVRLIYETDTGILFYDADGSKSGARIDIAQLDPGLVLTAADFFVI